MQVHKHLSPKYIFFFFFFISFILFNLLQKRNNKKNWWYKLKFNMFCFCVLYLLMPFLELIAMLWLLRNAMKLPEVWVMKQLLLLIVRIQKPFLFQNVVLRHRRLLETVYNTNKMNQELQIALLNPNQIRPLPENIYWFK